MRPRREHPISSLILCAGVASILHWDRPASAEERAMTLSEVIEVALAQNPQIVSSGEDVTAALASQRSVRGNFGPKLRFEANAMRWDKKLDFSLDIPPDALPIPIEMPPLTARETTTTQLSFTFIQPLTSLWSVYEGYKLKEIGVDVARVKRDVTRREVVFQVTEAFFRVLQAIRLAEIAEMSVTALTAQVERARAFYKNGLVNHNDVLRAELGLATAKQRLIQARGNVTLAQSRLAVAMGMPPDFLVIPKGIPTEAPPQERMSLEVAERRAIESRIELREIEALVRQAESGVRYARSKMLPSVNLLANYQRNTGSMFSPKNSGWVGIFLQWDFWEWGATYYGIPEAHARLRQALAARARVRDGLRLEARAAWIAQAVAREALEVAKGSVVTAEENFRLETKRYEARTNTSFDVVEAENQLTQARGNMLAALYDYLIARANLLRAVGGDIGSLTTLLMPSAPASTSKENAHAYR